MRLSGDGQTDRSFDFAPAGLRSGRTAAFPFTLSGTEPKSLSVLEDMRAGPVRRHRRPVVWPSPQPLAQGARGFCLLEAEALTVLWGKGGSEGQTGLTGRRLTGACQAQLFTAASRGDRGRFGLIRGAIVRNGIGRPGGIVSGRLHEGAASAGERAGRAVGHFGQRG